jgi:hypothetical protein
MGWERDYDGFKSNRAEELLRKASEKRSLKERLRIDSLDLDNCDNTQFLLRMLPFQVCTCASRCSVNPDASAQEEYPQRMMKHSEFQFGDPYALHDHILSCLLGGRGKKNSGIDYHHKLICSAFESKPRGLRNLPQPGLSRGELYC